MTKYSIVSEQKRKLFIKSVAVDNKGLTKMAKKFRIKLSTAKSIIRVFRKTGKILKKKPRVELSGIKKD
jgi:transposase